MALVHSQIYELTPNFIHSMLRRNTPNHCHLCSMSSTRPNQSATLSEMEVILWPCPTELVEFRRRIGRKTRSYFINIVDGTPDN